MKKICVLYGGPRKKNTYAAVQVVKAELERLGEVEFTEFFLREDGPDFCCGCYTCIGGHEEKCPHRQKLEPITQAIREADGLLFATPVYVMDVPGQLKALLDHYGYLYMIHRPMEEMFRKTALTIATAAGGGTRQAIDTVEQSLCYWGVPKRLHLGINIWANGWEAIAPKRRAKLEAALRKKAGQLWRGMEKRPRPGLKTRLMFEFLGRGAAGFGGADAEYWKEKQWLDGKRPWQEGKEKNHE